MQLNKDFKSLLLTGGVRLNLLEEYMSESIKTDREVFESVKEYLSPQDRTKKEQQLVNAGMFLSIIRNS